MQHNQESPFHAVGYALVAYVEAMLGFETEKIQIALERITAAEVLSRQFIKKSKRKSWHSNTTTEDIHEKIKSPEIQYELLATSCMLMSSTIQFMRNSWLEYMKAAYKLRKAYKLYEQMFESLTGQKASEYASVLRSTTTTVDGRRQKSTTPFESNSLPSLLSTRSWNEKRSSLFHISNPTYNLKRRPMSSVEHKNIPSPNSMTVIENAIESGIFFGTGLFSLVFSLLPPRGLLH